jgi:Secretion system C-terminal sorting domain
MKKLILIAGLLLSFVGNSQPINTSTKIVFIDKIDSVCNNLLVNFPVRVKNFTNIIGIQGTIQWDSAVLKFDSLLLNTNTSIIKFYDSSSNLQIPSGFVTFLWIDTNFIGVSIPDSSILFTLRLRVKNAVSYATPIFFSNSPTPLEIDTVSALGIPSISNNTSWQNGIIKFVDTPRIVQSGQVFTCTSNCLPIKYIWNIYNSLGVLIYSDTTTSNIFNVNSTLYSPTNSVTVTVVYANGLRIGSMPKPIILPLQLISFTAKVQKQNIVQLNWQTNNEVNVSHINIQRSTNALEFSTIYKMRAGNFEYAFTDELTAKEQMYKYIYYRLEFVDKNGNTTYSSIKNVATNTINNQSITIYPNPAKDNIVIEAKSVKEILIVNYLGKTVYKSVANRELLTVNVSQFAKGVYILKVITNTGEINAEKLIVE